MNAVKITYRKETVGLDQGQLEALFLQHGPVGADKIVNQALEDLAVGLSQLRKSFKAGQTDDMKRDIRTLIGIANQLGMTKLARIGRDALTLTDLNNPAACHAVLDRLNRVGEGSLIAVWDLQDMSV